ncbi:phosphatases II [Coprinopsis marcescibilis]|uniref:protein-tyrosine-phosphatase n=1 Tax=Coprinopsis marcescibilis TaxID=230819 RepID=A0A5C3LAM0_COPMA|nr:phosphatases II [Coprinopsis marcescibilis]
MDEVIPGLWLGSLSSAQNTENLRKKGIRSVVSVLRGRLRIEQTMIRYQISLDDTPDADILAHFIPAINFITHQLGKGYKVLVHCHAGISRSTTIVAAYLMLTRRLTVDAALDIIREARSIIDPNEGFLKQLEVFHQAKYQVSEQNVAVRRFYLERKAMKLTSTGAINLDHDVSSDLLIETTMQAEMRTVNAPSSSDATKKKSSRRIRCKMCRQLLAGREHMLDHGQIGPSTPSGSRRASISTSTDPNEDSNTGQQAESPSTVPTGPLPISILPDGSTFVDLTGLRPSTLITPSSSEPTPKPIPVPPPILINPKCSGYFVEPLKWMDPFLSGGELTGKIVCPNKKCNAKLGNYDWAGVPCGCTQWITPGFCINRSKVDEVVIQLGRGS